MAPPTSNPAYEFLDFNSPMNEATADALVEEVRRLDPSTVVDVGCGWAELLLRVLEACPDTTGVGIDNNTNVIRRANRNASARGLRTRLTLRSDLSPNEKFDVVLCIGSEHVFGSLEEALEGLQSFLTPGGTLFLGTLFWEQAPTPDLSADFVEVAELADVLAATEAAGWHLSRQRFASANDWDHFEYGYMRHWEQLALTADSKAARSAARAAADDYRKQYLKRREILGFAFLTLGRETSDITLP